MTIALLVCYDGTRLSGWQTQANADSVQSALERAVHDAFSENVRIAASGRTDSGVHAAGQVCSLSLKNRIAPERVADALNRYLPEDVRVLESVAAPEGFDASAFPSEIWNIVVEGEGASAKIKEIGLKRNCSYSSN